MTKIWIYLRKKVHMSPLRFVEIPVQKKVCEKRDKSLLQTVNLLKYPKCIFLKLQTKITKL